MKAFSLLKTNIVFMRSVTEIVYAPDDPPVTTTLESRPETTPEPQPEVPTPTPEPEEPKPDVPKPEEPKPYIDPTPTPEPTPTPTPTPAPEDNTPPENNTPPEDSAPPPSDSPSNLDDFAAMALKSHNDRRALHGVGPLEYDATMADYANNHVQSCIFEHSSPRVYGENLAAGYANIEAAIKGWYDEIKDYPFDKPDFYVSLTHSIYMILVLTGIFSRALVTSPRLSGRLPLRWDVVSRLVMVRMGLQASTTAATMMKAT